MNLKVTLEDGRDSLIAGTKRGLGSEECPWDLKTETISPFNFNKFSHY